MVSVKPLQVHIYFIQVSNISESVDKMGLIALNGISQKFVNELEFH